MRALILAYYFPPIGGGGVQRSLKFARYLPEHGYDVSVVTGPGSTSDQWSPRDETLQVEVGDTEMHRVQGSEPESTPWQMRGEKWLGLASPWSRWWTEGAVRTGLEIAGKIDVIVASMPPYQTAEAAAALSRELGCPWVADLRDHWAVDELMIYASGVHRRWELRRMRRLLSTASAVIAVSTEGAHRIRARMPEFADRPVASIPNGFDRNDFDDLPPPPRNDGVFRIVHTGSMYTDIGRRQRWLLRRLVAGSTPGVDILPHSHLYLLEAIERLIDRDPSLCSRIEVLLVGVVAPKDREAAERSSVVRATGYVPHREAIALTRTADLLFLPMYNLATAMRAATVPGKTYEYLAARRPILAAVPAGDLRDILAEAGNAHLCAPDDVEALATAIEGQLLNPKAMPAAAPDALLDRFERRRLTEELASVLDAVIRRTARGVVLAPGAGYGPAESAF